MRNAAEITESRVIIAESNRPQPISETLQGRRVERCLATPEQLLIRTTCGLEVRISWRDDDGRTKGRPVADEVRRWK